MIWRVLVGTFSIVLTMVVLGYVAVTEQDRMASFERAYTSRQIETGAALYQSACVECHGDRGQGGIGPSLSTVDLVCGARIQAIGYQGTVESYIRAAIAGGRPQPSALYANAAKRMPTWGEEYGGPYRKDQVDALVFYIMNWSEPFKDAQGRCAAPEPTPNPNAVGADITVELPAGDAARGQTIAETTGACVACHVVGANLLAPAWESAVAVDGKSVATHAAERFGAADYTGQATSIEQYIIESIVAPNVYIAPPGEGASWVAAGPSSMPQDYAKKLTKQDVADLIAYLLTLQ
jgi:mono/diheme cytochrome c family protein